MSTRKHRGKLYFRRCLVDDNEADSQIYEQQDQKMDTEPSLHIVRVLTIIFQIIRILNILTTSQTMI